MVAWDRREFEAGDLWSLGQFYALVPDAYELDLFEEAREGYAGTDVVGLSVHLTALAEELRGGADPAEPPVDASADEPPTLTQAQFIVERLLGGEVVNDRRD